MGNNYWIVINVLSDCLEHGMDRNKLKEASFRVDTELDKCLVGKLPIDELKRLKSVLDRLNYEIASHE